MKQRKKKPTPPPPPMVMDQHDEDEQEEKKAPPMERFSPLVESDDPVYLERHALAQQLQQRSAEEGFVLLKNEDGLLPLQAQPGRYDGKLRLNVFGRHSDLVFQSAVCEKYQVELNAALQRWYTGYQTDDAAYTGSGWDDAAQTWAPQARTSTGMFGGIGYIDPEPFIGHEVRNADGSVRVSPVPPELLQQAVEFSDTAAVVLYRKAGEGADHEKGDERLTEGEAGMLSFCTAHFAHVIVILACNSVIDGDFLVEDTENRFYQYTYGGGVYSNNIGNEILADYAGRTELRYVAADGTPAPHCYPIRAAKLQSCFYVCDNVGDCGAEALVRLLTGAVSPSGRLMDEIVYDYDDNPVSLCSGGLVFAKDTVGPVPYIYGHNYVAYREGVYLGYKYFETFRPERVIYPFGYGLSYTTFDWRAGQPGTCINEYDELQFVWNVTVTNTGSTAGREVVELYVTAPYTENGPYHLEKPLVSLAAFEKTPLLAPGESTTVTLRWNARDIACYSDTAECYVLEAGKYLFAAAANAGAAHSAPAAVTAWTLDADTVIPEKPALSRAADGTVLFLADEVTGTRYRNLFTGSAESGWRFDARGTEREHIVYLHRVDVDGVPTVAPGTYPESGLVDPITRETTQTLDFETRGLSSLYDMDSTAVHLYDGDVPVPVSNAVYRTPDGTRKNFMLQDVYAYLKDTASPRWHSTEALRQETGLCFDTWTAETDEAVWSRFLDQLSANEMLCRFYHCGFDIPALKEYGIPRTFSADTPGQIGANNPVQMFRTTRYCDTMLACTFDKDLCHALGLALAREVAASGESGTSYFYAPGSNLHRSCLSGKNDNYWSEDAYLSGQACGHFLKGLEEGGVNGCLKHFACNDQEISREGLVVFSNEQALRELYFAAFEHAIKIGGGKGIMTSLGRVGTVNACGNTHLTVDLLRKEWGFDGMVITDGYGVTSYMYDINVMLGSNSGLLCFGNSGNFGECRDFMELYRYYLQYPGRTLTALRGFMKGCMNSVLQSHTFRDLYTGYDYYAGPEAAATTDISWFDGQLGLGYTYHQAERLTPYGIQLMPGESNPPSMMPNTNCKDRGGTIAADDYGLTAVQPEVRPGEAVQVPVSVLKCAGLSDFAVSLSYDRAQLQLETLQVNPEILPAENYTWSVTETGRGADVAFRCIGNALSVPCGRLFDLQFRAAETAQTGIQPIYMTPVLAENGEMTDSLLDKQGHPVSITLTSQEDRYTQGSGWSGVYQAVEAGGWFREAAPRDDELADLTLLSGSIRIL